LAGGSAGRHFGEIAEDYDRLRPVDQNWRELFDVLVEEGDLRGRRVLEVGCGTGRLAAALADQGTQVWAVDPAPEMVAQARRNAPSVRFKQAAAEALPFKPAWFERAVGRLVLHLVERPAAFRELSRVLGPGGVAVFATFTPASVGRGWATAFFPEIEEIDRRRFPTEADLRRELEAAGFARVRFRSLTQKNTLTRGEALERIRGRYISTLRLLEEASYERGLRQAERELPETLEYALDWLVAAAELDDVRPGS
jgi:ubiquinone/menaquinone biosynthesis C-methylase UbiE